MQSTACLFIEINGRQKSNVVGHFKYGASEPVLPHAFEYWWNINKEISDRSPNILTAVD